MFTVNCGCLVVCVCMSVFEDEVVSLVIVEDSSSCWLVPATVGWCELVRSVNSSRFHPLLLLCTGRALGVMMVVRWS